MHHITTRGRISRQPPPPDTDLDDDDGLSSFMSRSLDRSVHVRPFLSRAGKDGLAS